MTEKTFLTIDELINNIKKKSINIKDENNVRKILETNNYYFIMGYKFSFKNNDILANTEKGPSLVLRKNP